jgi:hypothetical protein
MRASTFAKAPTFAKDTADKSVDRLARQAENRWRLIIALTLFFWCDWVRRSAARVGQYGTYLPFNLRITSKATRTIFQRTFRLAGAEHAGGANHRHTIPFQYGDIKFFGIECGRTELFSRHALIRPGP